MQKSPQVAGFLFSRKHVTLMLRQAQQNGRRTISHGSPKLVEGSP
jgi:hypothetical protein